MNLLLSERSWLVGVMILPVAFYYLRSETAQPPPPRSPDISLFFGLESRMKSSHSVKEAKFHALRHTSVDLQ
jgi:hypothetical protein